MVILSIDTSTDRSLVAIADRAGRIHASTTESARRHGRDLIPRIRDLLASAAIEPRAIGAIAVGLGPGSYTGTRVGVTAAKTLAYATGATLIGLDSLEAVGRRAPGEFDRVAVIADAQRETLYVAEFVRQGAGGVRIRSQPTRIEPLGPWVGRLAAGTVVMGPALASPRIRAAIPAEFLAAAGGGDGPDADGLVAMAREAIAAGRSDDLWRLEPLYLRRSAAEDQWDSRIATSAPDDRNAPTAETP